MRQTTLPPTVNGPSAFTLVELLVVITIIGILAALLLAAAAGAMGTAKQTRIRAEMEQFNAALEDYKNNIGSYPPNAQTDAIAVNSHLDNDKVLADFRRHLKKVAPSHREKDSLLRAIVGLTTPADSTAPTPLQGGMNAAEAIVFWLGGFSDDPKYPLTGVGGPSYALDGTNLPNEIDPIENRNWRLDIKIPQLGPRDNDGFFDVSDTRFIEYQDPRDPTKTRRIQFWYLKAPGLPSPYVYFDASRGSSATALTDAPAVVLPSTGYSDPVLQDLYYVHAIKRRKTDTSATEPYEYANDGKFQLLHGGLDEKWGIYPIVNPNPPSNAPNDPLWLLHSKNRMDALPLTFPGGPWTLNLADTLTNFSDGALEDSQP